MSPLDVPVGLALVTLSVLWCAAVLARALTQSRPCRPRDHKAGRRG